MKYLSVLAVAVVILIVGCAQAQTGSYKTGKVAVLPIINTTGDKNHEMCESQVKKGMEWFNEQFPRHGFTLIDASLVTKALEDSRLDLKDEESYRRENFFAIGEKLGVDYVAFVEIIETGQRLRQDFLGARREGWATLKVWFLKVDGKEAILNAKNQKGSSTGGMLGGFGKGTERQIQAVANGLKEIYKDFFKGFPETGKSDKGK